MPPTIGEDGKKHFAYGKTEIIRKEDMQVITDASCQHEYEPDHDDETDYYIAMSCTKCPHGILQRKGV